MKMGEDKFNDGSTLKNSVPPEINGSKKIMIRGFPYYIYEGLMSHKTLFSNLPEDLQNKILENIAVPYINFISVFKFCKIIQIRFLNAFIKTVSEVPTFFKFYKFLLFIKFFFFIYINYTINLIIGFVRNTFHYCKMRRKIF